MSKRQRKPLKSPEAELERKRKPIKSPRGPNKKPSIKLGNTTQGGKRGRPEILKNDEITRNLIAGHAEYGCTLSEMAAMMKIDRGTLTGFIDRHPEVKKAYDDADASSKRGLRKQQHELAMSGNPTMLIWLGKQRLDQHDRHELTGEGGESLAPKTFNVTILPPGYQIPVTDDKS
jgi:hypothetical protein